ncbi:unnamed protein product [Rodentolepis nana]|uniref:L51_S25_CI-B8 domain-containing protein n=1 Tax=Rodentolepis nana TaxID=102285 RepID=A0A0R3TI68_RODNA|nr:unnamed protein product [Rodentolepis nana]
MHPYSCRGMCRRTPVCYYETLTPIPPDGAIRIQSAGKEIKDMLNGNPLELIYSNKIPITYLHYNGTRTTPDLLLSSIDISEHTRRKIIDNPGSDPKPAIASITVGSKTMTTKVSTKLSWNFKKADWSRFTNLLEN